MMMHNRNTTATTGTDTEPSLASSARSIGRIRIKRPIGTFQLRRQSIVLTLSAIFVVGSYIITSTGKSARSLQSAVSTSDPPFSPVNNEHNELDVNGTIIAKPSEQLDTVQLDVQRYQLEDVPSLRDQATSNETVVSQEEDEAKPEESLSSPKTSKKRIPSILLAGTQKASTSAIAVYFMRMNNTCFSDADQGEEGGHGKEAHFFDHKYGGGLSLYQSLFHKCSDDDILIDATPEIMLHPQKVRDTYQEQGTADEVKIIFILREPIERSVSWYNHQLRYAVLPNRPFWTNGIVGKNGRIKSYIEHQRATVASNFRHSQYDMIYGHYAHWLKKWSKLFDRKRQILVLSFTELVQNPQRLLRRIHDFLDLPQTIPLELTRENTNEKKTPPPPCKDQLEMAKYFEGPNRELYKFLEDNPGPVVEQRPFPKFELACKQPTVQQTSAATK
jgi:Sulfotransferase domain